MTGFKYDSVHEWCKVAYDELNNRFNELSIAKFNSDNAFHLANELNVQLIRRIADQEEKELNLLTQIEFYQKKVRHLDEVIAKEYT